MTGTSWKRPRFGSSSSGLNWGRFDPEAGFTILQNQVNRLFDDFFGQPPAGETQDKGSFSPRLNLVDGPDAVTVHLELPGVEEKDVDISLTKEQLIITGERREEERDSQNRYHAEFGAGKFQRAIPIDFELEEDKVEASYRNGILTISLPKKNRQREAARKVTIKSS